MVSSARTFVKNDTSASLQLASASTNEVDPFKCAEFQEKIVNYFNGLRLAHVFTDVVLHCDDGQFDAHGCILAASSGFFKELFRKQGVKSNIRLPNIKSSVMSLLIEYIYTGNLQSLLTVQHLRESLLAARWLQIKDFLRHVSGIIHRLINFVNYNDVWNIADDFDNCMIAEEVILYIITNYPNLCMMPLFLKLSFQRLEKICSHQDFRMVPTYLALKSITNWVNYDKTFRSNNISELLSLVQVNVENIKFDRDNSSSNISEELLETALQYMTLEKNVLNDHTPEIVVTKADRKECDTAIVKSQACYPNEIFRQLSPMTKLSEKTPRSISVLMNPLLSPASICYSWSLSDKQSSSSSKVKLSVSSVLREPWDAKEIGSFSTGSYPQLKTNDNVEASINFMPKIGSTGNDIMAMVYAAQQLRSTASLSVPQLKLKNLTSNLFSPKSQVSNDTPFKSCVTKTTQLNPSAKARVPRLHLTATNNCGGISNSKNHVVDINSATSARHQRTFSDDDHQFSDVDSSSSCDITNPCPVRYPSTKSDIAGMLAKNNKVKTISVPETKLQDPNIAKSSQQRVRAPNPIPIYHPMICLSRSSARSSAFKPFVKITAHSASANFSSVHKKDNFPNRIQALPKCTQKTETFTEQRNKLKTGINPSMTARSELSVLQHQTITTWTRRIHNFDGSPYSEPVVAILGREKHGQLLLMSFNLDSHSWRLCENVEQTLEKHNFELFNNSGCVVHRNQVYLIGGEDKDLNQQNRVLIMDLREGLRLSLAAPLQVPRSCVGAAIFQDSIYVVGGVSFNRRMLDRSDRYVFESGEWQPIASFPVSGWGMSLAALGDRLVSIGGRRNGEWSLGCYCYDPDLNQWTQLLHMPKEFDSTYALVTLYGNRVLAFRRRNNPNESGSVAYLEPVHFTWSSPDVSGIPARRILTVARHRHKVWIVAHSSKLHVYDPISHTWENVYPFYRSIVNPVYAFVVYRAPPCQMSKM